MVSGRHDDAGQKLADELRALGAEAEFIQADVRHEEDVRDLVDRTVKRFGRLDVAVNNAGTEGKSGPIPRTIPGELRCHLRHQCPGNAAQHETRVARHVGPGKRQHRQPVIHRRPEGVAGASIYVASKHAVEGLTKSAALEAAAFGVRVNAVAPGPIDTDMLSRFTGTADRKTGFIANVPLKRAGKPDEVAQAIVYLASDRASFITGQIVGVDGGRMA